MLHKDRLEGAKIDKEGKGKNNKPYWVINGKLNHEWVSGIFFDDRIVKQIMDGEIMDLITYEEEYNGKKYTKFRVATKNDQLQQDMNVMASALNKLQTAVKCIFEACPEAKELYDNSK